MTSALITLRNRKTQTKDFRTAAHDIARVLADEALHRAQKAKAKRVVLVPVLRAGFALLPAFLEKFPEARIGFIGLKRNEETFKVKKYYQHLPRVTKSDRVIILDPMLATGGSAIAAIEELIQSGAREDHISFVGVISSPEGLENLTKNFPRVDIIIAANDRGLDKKKYIVPGLGDFGDRYFGT